MGVSILVFVPLLSGSTPTLYGTAKGRKHFELSRPTYAYSSCHTRTKGGFSYACWWLFFW